MQIIARIELHYSDWPHYERVHFAMAKLGFLRTVDGADGITYDLPHATYLLPGVQDASQALTDVLAVLAPLTLSGVPSIVICEAGPTMFYGLKPTVAPGMNLLAQAAAEP